MKNTQLGQDTFFSVTSLVVISSFINQAYVRRNHGPQRKEEESNKLQNNLL